MSSEDEQHKSSLAAYYFATQEYQNKSSAGVRPIFDDFYPKCSNLQLNFNNPFILLFQTCAWAKSSHHASKQRRRRAYAIAHRHPLRPSRMLVRMRAMLRHTLTLIAKPKEHLVHFDHICPENGQIWKPLWTSPVARQRQNAHCSSAISAIDKSRYQKQTH